MSTSKLWGGRFQESISALVERFSESVSFDQRLYRQDIRGSQAHAAMLAHVGVISAADDLYGTFDGARYTAAHIPSARFVGYPSGGHLWVGHQKAVTSEMVAFLQ